MPCTMSIQLRTKEATSTSCKNTTISIISEANAQALGSALHFGMLYYELATKAKKRIDKLFVSIILF